MKIEISYEEKKFGIIFKKPVVWLKVGVVFSNEELAIIRQRHLEDSVLDEWQCRGEKFNLTVTIKNLVDHKGFKRDFEVLSDAREYEQHVRNELLPNLKSYIDGNAPMPTKSDSFEL